MVRCGVVIVFISVFGIFSSVNISGFKVGQDENLKNHNQSEMESEKNCDNALSCLNLDVFLNVSKIIERDEYKLSDSLVLERYADVEGSEGSEDDERREVMKKKNGVTTYKMVKKVMKLFKTHALKYKVMKGLHLAVFREVEGGKEKIALGLLTDEPQRGARTFGVAVFRKRMMYILLAMTFKLGIIKTLLVTLLVLVLKGISIGVILLVLSFSSAFAKWKLAGLQHGHLADNKQGIHVHLHQDPHKLAYSGYAVNEEQPQVWKAPTYPTFHRRDNGQMYSVKEDADVGYPAVFRPPIYKQSPTVASIPIYQSQSTQYAPQPTSQYTPVRSQNPYGVVASPNSQYGVVSGPSTLLQRYEYSEEQPEYSNLFKRSSEEYQPVFEYQETEKPAQKPSDRRDYSVLKEYNTLGYDVEKKKADATWKGYSDVRVYKGLGYEVEEKREDGDKRNGYSNVREYKGLGYEVEETPDEGEMTKRMGYRMEDQPEFAEMFSRKN